MVELLIGPLFTPERVGGLVRLRDDGGNPVTLDPCRIVKVWYNIHGGFYIKYRADPSEAEALRGLVVSILLPDGLVELGRLPAIGGAFKINCG
jgi:hypothetical protein